MLAFIQMACCLPQARYTHTCNLTILCTEYLMHIALYSDLIKTFTWVSLLEWGVYNMLHGVNNANVYNFKMKMNKQNPKRIGDNIMPCKRNPTCRSGYYSILKAD